MNQNVSNNNSWMKLMGADAKTERLNNKGNGVTVAFSSFLSSQLNKANNMMSTGAPNTQKNTTGSNEDAKSLLKKVEPTANKLAVKSPERLNGNESKPMNQETVTTGADNVDNTTDKVVASNPETLKVTEAAAVEQVEIAMPVEVENTVSVEELAALLQQLMTSLIEQMKVTPDMSQKQPLQDQVQLISGLLNQLSQMKDLKIDSELLNRTKTAVDQILLAASNGEKIKPEMIESLKQVVKEVQSKNESSPHNDFSKVLEGKQAETPQGQQQTVQSTNLETNVNGNTTAKMTDQGAPNVSEKKETGETQVKQSSLGKDKVDIKVQTTEHKMTAPAVNGEFNAKLESASIAFSKVEVANQVSRVPLQQSIMDQLINSPRMQVKQTEQGTMMTMKLNPEVLGDVEIKMEIVKGVLQAEIKVESMIVKGAIEAGLSDLKNALSDKGYQVESLNVSVGKDGQFQQGQHQQQQNERHGHLVMDELEVEKGTYGFETVINDNQIDYRG